MWPRRCGRRSFSPKGFCCFVCGVLGIVNSKCGNWHLEYLVVWLPKRSTVRSSQGAWAKPRMESDLAVVSVKAAKSRAFEELPYKVKSFDVFR